MKMSRTASVLEEVMTNTTIKLLGRAATDEAFVELWNGTAEIDADTVTVTPIVPASAAGHELQISVLAIGGGANFAACTMVLPEPAAEGEPAMPRLELCSAVYGAFAGQVRRAPFLGSVLALCAVGTPQPNA